MASNRGNARGPAEKDAVSAVYENVRILAVYFCNRTLFRGKFLADHLPSLYSNSGLAQNIKYFGSYRRPEERTNRLTYRPKDRPPSKNVGTGHYSLLCSNSVQNFSPKHLVVWKLEWQTKIQTDRHADLKTHLQAEILARVIFSYSFLTLCKISAKYNV